jgi:hypothetical protein
MTTLIGGFLVWGGVGWLLDHWWGTRLMTPIGLILGMALGIYAVIAKVGKPDAAEMSPALRAASTTRHSGTTGGTARPTAQHDRFAHISQQPCIPQQPRSAEQPRIPQQHSPDKPQRRDGPPPAATRRETECP